MKRKSTIIAARRASPTLIWFLAIVVFVPTLFADQSEWSRFRGPNGGGIASNVAMPKDPTSAIQWEKNIVGIGHSSPIVWKDKLYVQSAEESGAKQYLLCIDTGTGKTHWQREIAATDYRIHNRNSFGSSTPLADESGVYVVWGATDKNQLAKFSHDGEPIWTTDIGSYHSSHGPAFTVSAVDELIIVPMLEEPPKREGGVESVQARILAIDKNTGEERWAAKRGNGKASYSTPCIFERDGSRELIFCNTAEGMFSLDPITGRENWSLAVFDLRTVSSPVVAGDLLLGTNGSGGGGNYLVAVRPGENPKEVFRVTQQAPYVPTPLFKDGLIFLWSDRGIASCLDGKTGESLWRERVGDSASASPICVGDQLIGVTDRGEVHVIKASRNYEPITKFSLGATTRATPAVANGTIFFRTESQLIAIRGEATGKTSD